MGDPFRSFESRIEAEKIYHETYQQMLDEYNFEAPGYIPSLKASKIKIIDVKTGKEYKSAAHIVTRTKDKKIKVKKGGKKPPSHLTSQEKEEIREKYVPWKYPLNKLANEYGVSSTAIKLVLMKKYK